MTKSPHTGGERGIVPDWRTIGITRRLEVHDPERKEGGIHLMGSQVDLRVSKHRGEFFHIVGGTAFGELVGPILGVVISEFHACNALA